MKRIDPEFDQWTDQNHVPYCPATAGQSQEISNAAPAKHGLNMLWHSVRKLFGHSHAVGHINRKKSKAFLSQPH